MDEYGQQQDLSPTKEILAFALKELTKDWTEEQQAEFSKACFNKVCTERYMRMKKAPMMKPTWKHQ